MADSRSTLPSISSVPASPAASPRCAGRAIPSTIALVGAAVALIVLFVALLFPWDSVARRVTFEINRASGGEIQITELRPAVSARGPVLAAEGVTVIHPAVGRVPIDRLEIAPRFSASWLQGEPTLRVWADSELGLIDGVLRFGKQSTYAGHVGRVAIEKLPLRLDASGLTLMGALDADADVKLDPAGVLTGRVDFESSSLLVQTAGLPFAIPFSRAVGVVEVLETGATRIEGLELDGEIVRGHLEGEIAMAHRSQAPPIDFSGALEILEPTLRSMAPSIGLDVSGDGQANVRIRGTLMAPEIETF